MRWPWVSRSSVYRVHRRLQAAKRAQAKAEAREGVLSKRLEASERERVDAQTKLTRFACGINPFLEELQAAQPAQPVPTQPMAEQPVDRQTLAQLSPEDLQAFFVHEAQGLYPGNIRHIQRHIEQRQAEFHASRYNQPLSQAERAKAQAVADDFANAIAEGRTLAAAR